jgi:hypothetical protein
MTNLTFSQELAMTLYNCEEQFPVDFDDAWVWLGYNKKQQAKEKLVRNFEKGLDFEVFTQMSVKSMQQDSQPSGGRPKEVIKLTVDCFATNLPNKNPTNNQNRHPALLPSGLRISHSAADSKGI